MGFGSKRFQGGGASVSRAFVFIFLLGGGGGVARHQALREWDGAAADSNG